jgi:hypothetical protein
MQAASLTDMPHLRLMGPLGALVLFGLAACGIAGSPERCLGLGEAECRAARGCRVINEACSCPAPPCGEDDCPGNLGRFIGCAPVESQCPAAVECRPAGQTVGPDERGCMRCSYATRCETAWQQLIDGLATRQDCRVLPFLVSGFSCAQNPVCVTACINQITYCNEIGCGLCEACVCGAVGRFEQCFFRCLE